MTTTAPSRQSDLRIISETIMADIPRGRDDAERLRFSFVTAESADGKPLAWHSLRVYWRDDAGEWRPGKAGVTIRGREIAPIAAALAAAASGGAPAPVTTTTRPVQSTAVVHRPAGARAPEHRQTSARQPSLPVAPPPSDGVNEDEVF
jgi:hypothetical protein